MFNTCLFKRGRSLYSILVKNDVVNMSSNKERFIVSNEDEILPEELKKLLCLYDKSSRSYRRASEGMLGWKLPKN